MSAHLGRTPTYEEIAARFFWYGIYNDVADYIQKRDRCQRLSFCCLHGVDGYHHLIVCIDYFTEWLEAKPIRDKTGLTVATFLYEFMCRHGCFKVQVNDQGREFVNRVSTCLREPTLLTGVEQSITSAYHPQSNGLVERQNRKIKNALVKVLDAHPEEWSHIIEGVLFACRVS